MSKGKKFDTLRSKLIKEAYLVADALERSGIVLDATAFRNLDIYPKGADRWGYSTSGVLRILDINPASFIRNIRPKSVQEISIEFTSTVSGDYSSDYGISEGVYSSNFSMQMLGSNASSPAHNQICCWHLDGEDGGAQSTQAGYDFFHPYYHVQHGGNTVRENGVGINESDYYGHMLLVDSPRLMHPPMDLILGFDFILCNFLPKQIIESLRGGAQYAGVVKNAQQLVWGTYFNTLAASCGSGNFSRKDNIAQKFNPQLILPS